MPLRQRSEINSSQEPEKKKTSMNISQISVGTEKTAYNRTFPVGKINVWSTEKSLDTWIRTQRLGSAYMSQKSSMINLTFIDLSCDQLQRFLRFDQRVSRTKIASAIHWKISSSSSDVGAK